jgi:benzoyl-CoA reductase/2-hydroxyglutaryl-CoA dehydratase subunit BcrC/BadD/HgdB
MVIPHSCDSAQRIYGIWKYYRRPAYSYLFSVPHMTTPWASRFFQRELVFFKESLERHTGHSISEERMEEAVRLYNDNRRIVAELYGLRMRTSPPITGAEMFKLLAAGTILPAEDFNSLLKEAREEVEGRGAKGAGLPRILFWGCIVDDAALYELIEGAGSIIVTDDTCIGTRTYLRNVDTSLGIMQGLTKAYFEDFRCPRTDRGAGLHRYDYVMDLIREYRADAVVCYSLSFCDPHKLDYPDLRDYLQEKGVPSMLIDDDYSLSNRETVLNRMEAFLETLG